MSDRVPPESFFGRIENGRPVLDDPDGFQRLKESLEGQAIEIRLSKRRKDRTSQSNRYYWGVVIKFLSDFTGHSREECHESLKHRFLIERTDEALPRVRSTSSLTPEEFTRYLDDCIQLAAELGCVIPDPR